MMRYGRVKWEVLLGTRNSWGLCSFVEALKAQDCCFWQNSDPGFSVGDRIKNILLISCIYSDHNLLSLVRGK